MIHDSRGNGHWLVRRMRDLFISKTSPRQHGKTPHVTRKPALRVRLPDAAVLGNAMLQTFRAFIRLANRVISEFFAFGKPEQRLVMSGEGFSVPGKAILVVPNDLPPVTQSQFVKMTLDPALVMVNSINEDAASGFQHTLALRKPLATPRQPFFFSLFLVPDAEVFLEIIRRVSDNQVGALLRQRA